MSLGDSLRRRAAHVPQSIRGGLMVVVFGLTAYWWATYSGLYRLLAEWQLARSASYEVELTGAFTALALLVPALVIIVILGASREGERGAAHSDRLAAEDKARRDRINGWMREHRRRVTALAAGTAATVWGAAMIASGLLAGARVPLDLAALERGAAPPGRYVELTGRVLAAEAVGVSTSRSSEMLFLPVVSGQGAPVRVYLKTSVSWARSHRREIAASHYQGLLEARALPGVAVTSFTERGRPPADSYWVLDVQKTPATQIEHGRIMMLIGVVLAGAGALVWWIKARRATPASRG
jgi:hypothetical protein